MRATLLLLTLVLLVPAVARADDKEPRKANPFAPSLRQLSDKEEAAIDRIIDNFIKFDTGRLPDKEGKQALAAFLKLGPDAIPGLIRGLNKAARIDASCPAQTIGKKLAGLLRTSRDPQLLEFARENIGAGVNRSLHQGVLRDLRVVCMLRKRVVTTMLASSRTGQGPKGEKPPRTMTVSELARAVTEAKGARLKDLLSELANRKGDEVIIGLHSVIGTKDSEFAPLARSLLTRHLSRLGMDALKKKLDDERIEVRAAAARAAGTKAMYLAEELVSLLRDDNAEVRKAAHESLVKLNKGSDYGPEENVSEGVREEAVKKWQAWLVKQGRR
jgi:hypothetical protein